MFQSLLKKSFVPTTISKILTIIIFGLLFTFPLVSPLLAEDEIKAEDIRIYTPVYQAYSEFNPPLGTYEYKVSWQGISAADVHVTVERKADQYKVTTKARTYSGIDLFYKLRYKAEGIISAIDLSPIKTVIDHRENSKHKITQITFEKDGGIHATRYRKDNGSAKEELTFNPKNFTLDPFSAAFLARGIEWKVGDSKQFDTFNGKSRYLITLTATQKKVIKVGGQQREVWEISPKVENLTSPSSDSKLRSAKIYLSTDTSREILQIVSSVFIGSVATTMTSFAPALSIAKGDSAMKIVSAKRSRQENSL